MRTIRAQQVGWLKPSGALVSTLTGHRDPQPGWVPVFREVEVPEHCETCDRRIRWNGDAWEDFDAPGAQLVYCFDELDGTRHTPTIEEVTP